MCVSDKMENTEYGIFKRDCNWQYSRFCFPSNRVVRECMRVCVAVMSAEPGRKVGYSSDIGWRVVWRRLGMEMAFKDISKHLQIAPSTAHRIFKRFQLTGDVKPLKQKNRYDCRKLDTHHELFIIALIMENPCIYLNEMCAYIEEATGQKVSGSTVCRILRRNGFSRKKVQLVANE